MPKSGQARVPTAKQKEHLFEVIRQHRHPEKNTAIMQVSFKLGLRAQEIALLQIKEVARLNAAGTDFELHEVMALPAAYTKGADALGRSKKANTSERRSVSISKASTRLSTKSKSWRKPVQRFTRKISIRQLNSTKASHEIYPWLMKPFVPR